MSLPRVALLQEAEQLVTGARNQTYGPPTQTFSDIAAFWTIRFRHKLQPGEQFTASDVAWAMILLKAARAIASPKKDNWVDVAGYCGCGYECEQDETTTRGEQYPDRHAGVSGQAGQRGESLGPDR